ncbi:histidine phosphatase family protein [Altericista sp. CCNU0014]|uniref:histidine phosphatase family protein n=1 Tax=Altericista sp. CCNU0014 TaxID=3082949 RepID=UPI00384F9B11
MIRHAESLGNREYRIQGRVDYALSAQGIEQAHVLGQALAERWKPTHIYSSTLVRAVHTAEILRDYWATRESTATITPCPSLQEIKNGVLEGLTWAEAEVRHPDLSAALMASSDWIPIPGAESLKAARDRAQQFIQTISTQHCNEDRLWVVTHGGFLQYLVAAILGSDRTWGFSIPPTALFEFELDLARWNTADQNRYNALLWRIHRFNDATHLKSEL